MSENLNNSPVPPLRKRRDWPALIAVGMMAIIVLIYVPAISRLLGPAWILAIYDMIVIGTAVFAAYLAVRLWRVCERGETLSHIRGSMALGLILWATGEIIWSTDQLWGGNSLPYPSLADLLWTLGYLPVILAFGLRLFTLKIMPQKWWQVAVLILYMAIFGLTVWAVIVPIASDPSSTRVFEKTINLLYPLGDLIVGFLAVTLVLVLIGGTLFSSWGMIALGFLFAAVSDLMYAWAVWKGTFEVNPAAGIDPCSFTINLLYVAFYLCVALGLYRQAKSIRAI